MSNQKEFEVISNPDNPESVDSSDSDQEPEPYSQDDKRFMLELYKENRDLLSKITEKEAEIARLRQSNVYLKNSNIFWLCCYFGSVFCTLISLTHH